MANFHVHGTGPAKRTIVAMPMKALRRAKTRLEGVLDTQGRQALALALFQESQRFFTACYSELDRVVVTPNAAIARRAQILGASALLEPCESGLNRAVERAAEWAATRRYDRILVVPCDIISWRREELALVLDQADRHEVVVVRSADGGTNGLCLPIPGSFAFRFGRGSADRHLVEAQRCGLSAVSLRLPALSRDLDTPLDYSWGQVALADVIDRSRDFDCDVASMSRGRAAPAAYTAERSLGKEIEIAASIEEAYR